MSEFLNSLNALDKVFLACAVAGGLMFLLRTVLQMVGHHGDIALHGGVDVHIGAGSGDSDAGFQILTLQGITVFIMMFGLAGLSFNAGMRIGSLLSIAGAFVVGSIALWIIAKLMFAMSKMESSGTLDMRNAVGQEGTVYLHIPPNGTGKARVIVQGRLMVFDAVSSAKDEIKSDERVIVVDVNNGVLVVEKY
jgi:membrane protein implicated in regulation of membrane protease activity